VYCSAHAESVTASLFFAAFVGGIGLISIPWALIVGGGLGLGVMVLWRVLNRYLASRVEDRPS
jgi:hypothetical protein